MYVCVCVCVCVHVYGCDYKTNLNIYISSL